MKHLNKVLCMLLSFAMVLGLAACGAKGHGTEASSGSESAAEASAVVSGAPEGSGSAPAEAEPVPAPHKVALFAAQGGESSVQEAGASFCQEQGLECRSVDAVSEREGASMVEELVQNGFDLLVFPGEQYTQLVADCAPKYPDALFIGVDMPDAAPAQSNVCVLNFQEEVAGFMAGYVAVQEEYTKLAFLGREDSPTDARYGSGFLQGASCAAMEFGYEISMEYGYCDQLPDDAAVTAAVGKWYKKGTQVVFTTGHYEAVAQAAAKAKGLVIGADADQSALIDQAGKGLTLTCAVKNPAEAVRYALDAVVSGNAASLFGTVARLGVVDSKDSERNFVGLSVASTQWTEFYDEMSYNGLVEEILNEGIVVLDEPMDRLDLIFRVHSQQLS